MATARREEAVAGGWTSGGRGIESWLGFQRAGLQRAYGVRAGSTHTRAERRTRTAGWLGGDHPSSENFFVEGGMPTHWNFDMLLAEFECLSNQKKFTQNQTNTIQMNREQ
jgi:hypothetical protein